MITIKQKTAIVFFNVTINNGDKKLLADLNIITAILQQKAANKAEIIPK